MNKEQEMREYIRKLANKEIIMKRLFLRSLEDKYGDDYIKTMYRISPLTIREVYNVIDEKERTEIEETLKKQIEAGELKLEEEAKRWHRESLKNSHNSEINKSNKKGETR